MSLTVLINQIKLSWWHFFICLFVLAWPLAASLFFLYDRLFFLQVSFLKLNLIFSAVILPVVLFNGVLVYLILKVRSSVTNQSVAGSKSLLRGLMVSLFIAIWMLVGGNICGLLKVELRALWLYAAIVEGLIILILGLIIYLEYIQGKALE